MQDCNWVGFWLKDACRLLAPFALRSMDVSAVGVFGWMVCVVKSQTCQFNGADSQKLQQQLSLSPWVKGYNP